MRIYDHMRDAPDRDGPTRMAQDSMCISPTVRHLVPMQRTTSAFVPACGSLKVPQSLPWNSVASTTTARQPNLASILVLEKHGLSVTDERLVGSNPIVYYAVSPESFRGAYSP